MRLDWLFPPVCMRGATVKETLYLASEHGRHSVFETQIARPPDRIFFADTMIFVVHDPTSFQLLYISCINKGNLPTYLPTHLPTYTKKLKWHCVVQRSIGQKCL